MKKEKIKVYLYTRVSTTMQIDDYSLDAQKTKRKAFCDYNEYEIAGEYERKKIHLLSGILKCPVCGAGMYGNKSIKKRKDGSMQN